VSRSRPEDPHGEGRITRQQIRRARRRRRIIRGATRGVIWLLVGSAVFVFGVGFGRTLASDSAPKLNKSVQVTNNRGTVVATLPTTTVTTTVTVTRKVKVREPRQAE
jgi:hypothetical protein